jgi:DNA-binding NtrC family response regulator
MTGACQTPFERGPRLCRVCTLHTQEDGTRRCGRVVAQSAVMQALMKRAAAVAPVDASVVIQGETGSGKEVVAQVLHANSRRAGRPFVAVNVAALPGDLLESELFGHAKGAFTGAVAARRGLMETAHGGTLFLDEMGEMPLALQAKLLRALQDGEVRRVGDSLSFRVDVRILCATHRDLRTQVERGLFREDLYWRLKVFTLSVPPLRERREDVLPLAGMFLAAEGLPDTPILAATRRALLDHDWPGNVRELGNAIKHAVALSQGAALEPGHLPDEVVGRPVRQAARSGGVMRSLAAVEQEHIMTVLQRCGGSQAEAARILGIGRNTLWRKLRAMGGPDVRVP